MLEGKEEITTCSYIYIYIWSIKHASPYNAGFCYVEKYKHDSNAKCVAVWMNFCLNINLTLCTSQGRRSVSSLIRWWQQLLLCFLICRFTHIMMFLTLKKQLSYVDSVYCSTLVAWAPLVFQDECFAAAGLVPLALCWQPVHLPDSLPSQPFFLVGVLQWDAPAISPLLAPVS